MAQPEASATALLGMPVGLLALRLVDARWLKCSPSASTLAFTFALVRGIRLQGRAVTPTAGFVQWRAAHVDGHERPAPGRSVPEQGEMSPLQFRATLQAVLTIQGFFGLVGFCRGVVQPARLVGRGLRSAGNARRLVGRASRLPADGCPRCSDGSSWSRWPPVQPPRSPPACSAEQARAQYLPDASQCGGRCSSSQQVVLHRRRCRALAPPGVGVVGTALGGTALELLALARLGSLAGLAALALALAASVGLLSTNRLGHLMVGSPLTGVRAQRPARGPSAHAPLQRDLGVPAPAAWPSPQRQRTTSVAGSR